MLIKVYFIYYVLNKVLRGGRGKGTYILHGTYYKIRGVVKESGFTKNF